MISTDLPPRALPKPGPSSRKALVRKRRLKNNLRFYLFASPWLLGFLALTVFPLGYAFVISFTNFDGINEKFRWVGLLNYVEVFHDALAWTGFLRTLLYTLIVVPGSIAGGLGLALLLNRRLREVGLFRTIFYLPSVIPAVGTAIMFQLLFDHDTGGVNAFLELFHVPLISWLIDPTAFLVLVIMVLWGMGGGMVISLAGLQGISAELLEAATVDGANAWVRFWRITLPLLSPILFFQIVTGTIFSLQTLVQPLLLSGSGSGQNVVGIPTSNQLYMLHVYTEFFYYQRFGYGSALLWILFALILLATLFIFRSSTFLVYYEIDQQEG